MSELTMRTRRPRGVPGILQSLKLAGLALVATLAAACGGEDAGLTGGGLEPATCVDCGTALLTVTDAPGDFQSYTVDVTSLSTRSTEAEMREARYLALHPQSGR